MAATVSYCTTKFNVLESKSVSLRNQNPKHQVENKILSQITSLIDHPLTLHQFE